MRWIGPELSYTNQNIWGYDPDELRKTRDAAKQLPIISHDGLSMSEPENTTAKRP